MPHSLRLFMLTVLIGCLNLNITDGGEITGDTWSSGIASVGLQPIVPPVSPNNDDFVGTSPNAIFIPQKAYTGIGPVDIQFSVINSGGVTEYSFIEGVFNGTGIPWTDYHMELGSGTGTAFVPSPSGDGLDFDFPHLSSPFALPPFTTVNVNEDNINAFNGTFPSFAYYNFKFHIDVPDGISTFTVRQYPSIDSGTVPEPSSLSLLVGMCVAAIHLRRRRSNV